MNIFIAIVISAVLTSVNSDCGDPKCAVKTIKDILKNETVIENIDIKLEVPKFQQINNVGIEDLNLILLNLARWFEDRINETNFDLKHISNKTKIYVKSFDFNVDFEKGNANIDVDLTEDVKNRDTEMDTQLVIELPAQENAVTTENGETEENLTTTQPTVVYTAEPNKQSNINKQDMLARLKGDMDNDKENDIFNVVEFDTSYYDVENEDNSTDYPILDYVEMYKDTTNEENVYLSTEGSTAIQTIISGIYDTEHANISEGIINQKTHDLTCHGDVNCQNFSKAVFPWIVTIFITNDTKESQFSYQCDGAILSDKVIITDARCMHTDNKTLDPDNVLVFLGKANLRTFGESEKVIKIKDIILHPNFTVDADGKASYDLALLIMEDPVVFTDDIQSACLHQQDVVEEAATTAWSLTGSLLPIFFNKEKSDNCYDKDDDVFCATYGNEVALCPSYGGVYATKQANRWCLQGIFYGDPADRGICFSKDVFYTSLKSHMQWIVAVVDISKNYIL